MAWNHNDLSIGLVESQRILSVVEEVVERLSFLGSLTPDVLAHTDELSQSVGDEVSKIITDQRNLEITYEELVKHRIELKGLGNKTAYKENQVKIKDVSLALRESTKMLCRNLKENPNVSAILLKIQEERVALQDILSITMRELSHCNFDTLTHKVEEEKKEQEHLEQTISLEKETTTAVESLKNELLRTRKEHKSEVSEKMKIISALKNQVIEIKTTALAKHRYAKKEAKAKLASTIREYKLNKGKLNKVMNESVTKRNIENLVHKNTSEFVAKMHDSLTKDLTLWAERMEREVEAKDEELLKLEELRKTDLEELNSLQARFDKDLAVKVAWDEEERRLIELKRIQRIEEMCRTKAARKIEIKYLEYKTKKLSKKKKKGKKEKNGKKGKGKKKK